jgi:hypothetical protein
MALHRHKKAHLPAKLEKAHRAREQAFARRFVTLQESKESRDSSSAETLLDRVLRFQRAAEEILANAKRGQRDGAALGAIARLTELLKVEGAVLQAARQAAETVCPRCQRNAEFEKMTPERINDFLLRHKALDYLRDPAGFLESVRNRAAVEIAECRRIPMIEARTTVDAQEAAAVENQGEGV